MSALSTGPAFGLRVNSKTRRVVLTVEASADDAQQLAPILRTLHGLGVSPERAPLSLLEAYGQVSALHRAALRRGLRKKPKF